SDAGSARRLRRPVGRRRVRCRGFRTRTDLLLAAGGTGGGLSAAWTVPGAVRCRRAVRADDRGLPPPPAPPAAGGRRRFAGGVARPGPGGAVGVGPAGPVGRGLTDRRGGGRVPRPGGPAGRTQPDRL